MSKYTLAHGTFCEVDELYHYGVRGMRWGVRRATKQLSKATTKEDREKNVAKLNKHRSKATAKLAKLEKRNVKLAKNVDNVIMKTDVKAADLRRRSSDSRNRAYGLFVSKRRAEKRLYKADKLAARADALMAKSQQAKSKLESNKKMIESFKRGISDIDAAIVSSGKKYLG